MNRYRNPAMKQLSDQQIRFAPRDVRIKQIERAEQLLESLNPDRVYLYRDLCEKITAYKPELHPNVEINGNEAVHDLRCFVEDLSESAELTVESAGEEVLTVEDVSRQFNVSTKTVSRWRDKGLASRRYRFGKKTRLGFLRSVVERFAQRHAQEIDRSRSFSQLSSEERERMIRAARELAAHGDTPTEVNHKIAEQFHRAPETVRYTVKHHDREHPEAAVFPDAADVLSHDDRRELYRRFLARESIESLCNRFQRTRTSVYRIVAEMRALSIIEQHIDYMDSDDFRREDAESLILGPAPEPQKRSGVMKAPPGLPPYLASLYAIPLLTREEETYYFRKMNFLKYQAARLQAKLDPAQPKAGEMDRIDQLIADAVQVKNFLIRSNLRLVVSIAKRHVRPNMNFFEMVSDGNMSLIRAIEKFDFTRGFKFSTYASWAIMKNFARSIPAEDTQLERFRTGNDEVFMNSTDPRTERGTDELVNHRQHEALMRILSRLEPRERDIIVFRFGLDKGASPRTLEQTGHRFGVTKERIRQVEVRTLKKLRKIAEEEHLEIPGI